MQLDNPRRPKPLVWHDRALPVIVRGIGARRLTSRGPRCILMHRSVTGACRFLKEIEGSVEPEEVARSHTWLGCSRAEGSAERSGQRSETGARRKHHVSKG